MGEPWKTIICSSEDCMSLALDANGNVREGHHIKPDYDNGVMTQFTCPRCGTVKTWGVTRREVARILYERIEK